MSVSVDRGVRPRVPSRPLPSPPSTEPLPQLLPPGRVISLLVLVPSPASSQGAVSIPALLLFSAAGAQGGRRQEGEESYEVQVEIFAALFSLLYEHQLFKANNSVKVKPRNI